MARTEFDNFLAERIRKDRGVLVPVKASLFELMFVKKADCRKLHPNPDDEFCDPTIGPNYQIISRYAEKIVRGGMGGPWKEPLIVQKVHPEGYRILNGHHRWAAALKTGYNPVKISIANVTQEKDIERMIRNCKHDKRVTLDLDEVAFCRAGGDVTEKALPFPLGKMYKERLRLGIPALLRFFGNQGYDVWVYTAQYYSIEYIRAFFRHYFVKVDGIVTGAGRTTKNREASEKQYVSPYTETLHIDSNLILRTWRDSREFEEYAIDAAPAEWSGAVMDIVGKLERREAQ